MPKLSTLILATGGMFALALPLGSPAMAGAGQDILVTSQAEMESWRETATRDLNTRLRLADRFNKGAAARGIVQIRFMIDERGKARDLSTHSNTAGRAGERTAMKALRNMRTLNDAPVADAQSRVFQANVIFASSREERERLAEELNRSERARLASAGPAAQIVALGN